MIRAPLPKLSSAQLTVLRDAKAGHVYRSEHGHDLYACYDRAQNRKKVTAIVDRLYNLGLLRIGELAGLQRLWHVTEQGNQALETGHGGSRYSRKRVSLDRHRELHEPGALRRATDRQLRGFYYDEKLDVARARAEAARRGILLHARKSSGQLDHEIAELVPSWRGKR